MLNGVEGVSPGLQERVQQAAEELGYIPNRSARMLKSGRTWYLGLILPFASDLFYSRLLDAYNEAALERGYRLDIHFHQWNPKEEERAIRHLIETGAEGVIVHSCAAPGGHPSYLGLLDKHQIRYAVKRVHHPEVAPLAHEYFLDLEKAAELLAEHLIDLGHVRLGALVPGTLEDAEAGMKARLRGIRSVVERHPGVTFQPLYMEPSPMLEFSPDGGNKNCAAGVDFFQRYTEAMVSLFTEQTSRSTAVITFNQMTAWRLIQALRDEGLDVPEDISVASMGISHIEHFAGFPLTAAEFSPMATARVAVAIALGEVSFPPPVPPTLACRRSTAPAPALLHS